MLLLWMLVSEYLVGVDVGEILSLLAMVKTLGRHPWYHRLFFAATAIAMATVLTIAANLQPAAAGMGTHQQLGLAPCFFPEKLGFPCPACGMTTSWSYLMNGEVTNSARVNFGGFLLALACIISVPWLLLTAIQGKWVVVRLDENWLLVCLVSWLALTLFDWVVRRLIF